MRNILPRSPSTLLQQNCAPRPPCAYRGEAGMEHASARGGMDHHSARNSVPEARKHQRCGSAGTGARRDNPIPSTTARLVQARGRLLLHCHPRYREASLVLQRPS